MTIDVDLERNQFYTCSFSSHILPCQTHLTSFRTLTSALYGVIKLTHISLDSFLCDMCKQCRFRSDAAGMFQLILMGNSIRTKWVKYCIKKLSNTRLVHFQLKHRVLTQSQCGVILYESCHCCFMKGLQVIYDFLNQYKVGDGQLH